MNRRAFLRVLGLGGVTVAAAPLVKLTSVPLVAPPIIPGAVGTWGGVKWSGKEFDWGHSYGVALEVVDAAGNRRRHGARVVLDQTLPPDEAIEKAGALAKPVLEQWLADLNAGLLEPVPYDYVLEGHELPA